eukprot:1655852-Pleurochrysis_carterae.AAC.2
MISRIFSSRPSAMHRHFASLNRLFRCFSVELAIPVGAPRPPPGGDGLPGVERGDDDNHRSEGGPSGHLQHRGRGWRGGGVRLRVDARRRVAVERVKEVDDDPLRRFGRGPDAVLALTARGPSRRRAQARTRATKSTPTRAEARKRRRKCSGRRGCAGATAAAAASTHEQGRARGLRRSASTGVSADHRRADAEERVCSCAGTRSCAAASALGHTQKRANNRGRRSARERANPHARSQRHLGEQTAKRSAAWLLQSTPLMYGPVHGLLHSGYVANQGRGKGTLGKDYRERKLVVNENGVHATRFICWCRRVVAGNSGWACKAKGGKATREKKLSRHGADGVQKGVDRIQAWTKAALEGASRPVASSCACVARARLLSVAAVWRSNGVGYTTAWLSQSCTADHAESVDHSDSYSQPSTERPPALGIMVSFSPCSASTDVRRDAFDLSSRPFRPARKPIRGVAYTVMIPRKRPGISCDM